TKSLTILMLLFIVLPAKDASAQSRIVEAEFEVSGNCGMCKRRIEAALAINGIKYAEWNVETKTLKVAYRRDKFTEKEIHARVAATGHDTELTRAADETYSNLPFCCLYRDHDHSNIVDEPETH